ncbi:alpha/beta fold hydrolase [Gordonia crocea]|uniref:Alpha/beta hydrolase n=1 Tax=Gordonia crocea TaxID=589162 RepID=A0A7M3SUJ1_9ACTN|nr:alpha/beta fold hydrolase [Gordonia crocea]GED96315.1 alpha/beta hydrolase [Gordonia crocea]
MADRPGAVRLLNRLAERELGRGGGRVRRPAGDTHVDIAYLRTGPRVDVPIVVIPGGPGLASTLPYRALRREAADQGLDLVMMEHRGVGLSRFDVGGTKLPVSTVTISAAVDDLAAVLDDAGISRAVIYGSSYGTYLAQMFGVRHPERVASMVLDSPILSVVDDLATTRAYRRGLLLDGPGPVPAAIRALVHSDTVDSAELGHVVTSVYDMAGSDVLRRLVDARRRGRARIVWRRIAHLGRAEIDGTNPYVMEPDLVAGISYRELGYAHNPDGLPLDPVEAFADHTDEEFVGEPVFLPDAIPAFTWPTAVIAGSRDLVTPPPISARIAGLIPQAALVELPGVGHSALDSHRRAALAVIRAMLDGQHRELPRRSSELAALPRRGSLQIVAALVRAGIEVDSRLPL